MSLHAASTPWLDEFSASYRDLLRFLRRRTGCAETARELAQDAWLRVAERHAAGNTPGNIVRSPLTTNHARAYLFTVADRLAIDHLRRQRHWHDELAPRLLAGPIHAPDVAESHAYAQALRAVDTALAEMPPRMRDVFVAHRLHGVPHDELAQRFGVSRKTIEREVTRAMDLAQAALAPPPAPAQSASPRQGRRKAMSALLGLAGASGTGSLIWQLGREQLPPWQAAYATAPGEVGRLALPDGSEIMLDADSAVDVRLLAARREAHLLRGAAFFSVASAPARPFIVQAGSARITVLGTRFSVEHRADGVQVSVEHGRVAVQGQRDDTTLALGAGDTARVDPTSPPVRVPGPPADRVAAWRTGWLDFDQLPLARVAEQLNRYRPRSPVRVEPAVAGLPVLARVQVGRSSQWLQSLPGVLPVRVEAQSDGSVLIAAR